MYPFLPQAKALAPSEITHGDIEDAVYFLRERLSEDLFANPRQHVVLYALAKALLSCCSQATKTRLASQKAHEYVGLMSVRGEAYDVCKFFFPSLEKKDAGYSLSLRDYLKCGENLVHQSIEKGSVEIGPDELNAILQKAIQEKFLDASAFNVPEDIREASKQLEPPMVVRSFNKKFLSLGCMQHIAQGVDEGRRFYGAFGLSIAAQKDGLTREQALSLLTDYVQRCKGIRPFTIEEARSILEWVNGRSIGFSCRQTMDNGFEGSYCEACPLNWKRRKV